MFESDKVMSVGDYVIFVKIELQGLCELRTNTITINFM